MKMTKMTLVQKNKINKFALYGLILFVAFTIADLTIIYYRDRLLPDQAPPKKAIKMDSFQNNDRSQYSVIHPEIYSHRKAKFPML